MRQKSLSNATHTNTRLESFHLYRLYNKNQPDTFVNEITILLCGPRQNITKDKQGGEGSNQTKKISLSYGTKKQINERMLDKGGPESVFGRAFLCLN